MLTGLYSAASGMIIQERVQDTLAYNLANSQIPGFCREEVVVRSFPDVMLSAAYGRSVSQPENPRYHQTIGRLGTGAGIDWIYVDHSAGQMVYTGDSNDLALFGDGFFTLLSPDGQRYTRSGNFHVDKEGYLVNSQGYYVMGQGINNGRQPGRIQVGQEHFHVDGFGQVLVQRPNQQGIMSNVVLDQIRVIDFTNEDKLFREAGNIYRVEEDDADNFKIPVEFRVAQGYLEKSNSIPTTEMVKLIDSYRIHEASARVIRALDQTLNKAVNELAR